MVYTILESVVESSSSSSMSVMAFDGLPVLLWSFGVFDHWFAGREFYHLFVMSRPVDDPTLKLRTIKQLLTQTSKFFQAGANSAISYTYYTYCSGQSVNQYISIQEVSFSMTVLCLHILQANFGHALCRYWKETNPSSSQKSEAAISCSNLCEKCLAEIVFNILKRLFMFESK